MFLGPPEPMNTWKPAVERFEEAIITIGRTRLFEVVVSVIIIVAIWLFIVAF